MAVANTNMNTIHDVILSGEESHKQLANMLMNDSQFIADMPMVEANSTTQNKSQQVSGLPSSAYTKLGGGVKPTSATTVEQKDDIAILKSEFEISQDTLDIAPNRTAFLNTQLMGFTESMTQATVDAFFYANGNLETEKFIGIEERFNTLDITDAKSAKHVIDCGGTGARLTSIYLIGWGLNSVFGIYPRGSKSGGLEIGMLDENQTSTNLQGEKIRVAEQGYKWLHGLTILDWRYIVRLANVDIDKVLADPTDKTAGNVNLPQLFGRGATRIRKKGNPNLCAYMHTDLREIFEQQIINSKNVQISTKQVGGEDVDMFKKFKLRNEENLSLGETRVTA